MLTGSGAYRPNSKTTLRNIRRAVQLICLALWVFLFLAARQQALALIPPDLFLMTDPLVAAVTMGAAHVFVPIMLTSLVFVVVGLVLGRVFCGWICPLGTLIDAMGKVFNPPEERFSLRTHERLRRWKYYILAFVVFGALLSSQWVYLLDPLVVLFRGAATGIFPLFGGDFHEIVFLPLGLLVAILLLTAITRRFYCRYLCPLGALYGLLARLPLLRRRVKGCDACAKVGVRKQCISGCRMGAVPPNPHRTLNHECIRCFSGRSFCHTEAIRFDFIAPVAQKPDAPLSLDRRRFLIVGAAGLGLAPLVSASKNPRGEPNRIIRPPRVGDENTFMSQCVRCGMCVQACPTQTLQLLHLEAGFSGMWTPAVTPRIGGCTADCTACGDVCPTNAIVEFTKHEADKWVTKMGTAVLETSRCISYTDNTTCKKCFQVCPTWAFEVEPADGTRPMRPKGIKYDRCVGCGLCEHACRQVVFGRPAILTFSHGRGQPTSLPYEPTESIKNQGKG